jgi:hypothetical protein
LKSDFYLLLDSGVHLSYFLGLLWTDTFSGKDTVNTLPEICGFPVHLVKKAACGEINLIP